MTSYPAEPVTRPASAHSTRDALAAAGLARLAEHGYSGSRLADIAGAAGLTTGAFYRYFDGKLDFYRTLFDEYAGTLQSALNASDTLREQISIWIDISRQYRGVIRAATELARRDTTEAAQRRNLRETAAHLLARHLTATASWQETRTQALMLVDILEQYVLMEAAGWTVERRPADVANALSRLISDGLYST